MKLVSFVKRTVLGALICAALSLPAQTISIETEHFAVDFQVGDDGRLYQRAIGAANVGIKLLRDGRSLSAGGRRLRLGTSTASRPCGWQYFNDIVIS